LAFDLGVADPRLLPILGSLWEKYGLGVWGGRFHDPVHFEATLAVKKAAGWHKGAFYSAQRAEEPALEKQEPIGKVIETIVTPWWSFLVPFDPIDWINKHF